MRIETTCLVLYFAAFYGCNFPLLFEVDRGYRKVCCIRRPKNALHGFYQFTFKILQISVIFSYIYSKRENFGEDLLALNIQRARDHGIPAYNAYRKACGLRSLTSWSQRPTELEEEVWTKMQEVYDNVEDIDLYVGGIAETRCDFT